jgi:hypothetical protein
MRLHEFIVSQGDPDHFATPVKFIPAMIAILDMFDGINFLDIVQVIISEPCDLLEDQPGRMHIHLRRPCRALNGVVMTLYGAWLEGSRVGSRE